MTHTSGPWKHVPNTSYIGTDEEDTQTICYLDDHRNRRARSRSESNANGLLIAASPELLQALEDLIGMCNMPEVRQAMKHNQAYYHGTMRAANHAVYKAKNG